MQLSLQYTFYTGSNKTSLNGMNVCGQINGHAVKTKSARTKYAIDVVTLLYFLYTTKFAYAS